MTERVFFETAEVYFGKCVVTMLYNPGKLFVYRTHNDYVDGKPEYILPYLDKEYARDWANEVAATGVFISYEY